LKRARRRRIDVGVAKGPWGRRILLEGIGAGLFAEVMAGIDSGRRRKRPGDGESQITRFARGGGALEPALHALLEMLPHFRAAASQVSIDNNHIHGRLLLFEALNMPYLGPNLHLAPDADPSDGMLDFVLLGEGQREEFQGYLKHRLDGGHDAPILSVVKGRRLHFVWRGSKLHVDDKIVPNGDRGAGKRREEIEIYIKPSAMEFLSPRLKGAPRHRAKIGAGRRALGRR
jgi:diacylglycerol kinase family enzyme